MGFCDQCGTRVTTGARFCAACGSPVDAVDAVPGSVGPQSPVAPLPMRVGWTPPGALIEWASQLAQGDRLRHTATTIAKIVGPTLAALVLVALAIASDIDTDEVAVNVAALGVKAGLLALPVLFGGMFTGTLEFSSLYLTADGTATLGGAVTLVPFLVVAGVAVLLRHSPILADEAPPLLAVRTGLLMAMAVTVVGVVGRHRFTITEGAESFRFLLTAGMGRAALWAFLLSAGAVLVAFADRLDWEQLPEPLPGFRAVVEATAYSTVALVAAGTAGAVVLVFGLGADSAFEGFNWLLLFSLLYLPVIVVNLVGVGLGATVTAEASGSGSWFGGLALWPTESIGWFGDLGVAWWVLLLGVALGGAALYVAGLRAANRFGPDAQHVLLRAAPLTALVWVLASRLATLSLSAEGVMAEEMFDLGRQGVDMTMGLSVAGTFLVVGVWTLGCSWVATRTTEQGTQWLAQVPVVGRLVDVAGPDRGWPGPRVPPPAGPPPSTRMSPPGMPPTPPPAGPPPPTTAPPPTPWVPPTPPSAPPPGTGPAQPGGPLPGKYPPPHAPGRHDDDHA